MLTKKFYMCIVYFAVARTYKIRQQKTSKKFKKLLDLEKGA